MPPRFRLCPLCQQGFGSASLDIHIPQCYQKALKRWQVNPVGPMPIMPGSKPPLSRGGKHGNSGVPCNRSAFVKQSSHDGKSSQNIPEYIEENANLHPCSRCGRKFLFDRIAYHESVCKANMKLKVFDSRKQRAIEGQSDDVFRGTDTRRRKKDASSGSKATVPSPGIPRTRWREQHREFIEAMRAARGAHKASAAMWGDASVKEVQLKPSRLKCTPPAVTRHMKGFKYLDNVQSIPRRQVQ
ncbi:putative zinc finger of a C2HC type [Trypanosoma vivax]|nr:putative zinc finger of a C2HC type [Trypanosoma vivax]